MYRNYICFGYDSFLNCKDFKIWQSQIVNTRLQTYHVVMQDTRDCASEDMISTSTEYYVSLKKKYTFAVCHKHHCLDFEQYFEIFIYFKSSQVYDVIRCWGNSNNIITGCRPYFVSWSNNMLSIYCIRRLSFFHRLRSSSSRPVVTLVVF